VQNPAQLNLVDLSRHLDRLDREPQPRRAASELVRQLTNRLVRLPLAIRGGREYVRGVMNATETVIRAAKQHTVYAVTVGWAEGDQHTLRFVEKYPHETVVGPGFKSKKALRKFAATHGITISAWH
jgi:hypothetical protein